MVTAAKPAPPAGATAQVPAPSGPFVGASWAAALLGIGGFLYATYWATDIDSTSKYLLVTALCFGLYGIVGVAKATRDRMEGISETTIAFVGISWIAALAPILILGVFLVNSDLPAANQGMFAALYLLAAIGAITVQKNVRDSEFKKRNAAPAFPPPPSRPQI